jgi:endonuclease YncB( thermonuclease family)
MRILKTVLVSLALFVLVSSVQAKARTIVGAVKAVSEDSVQVMTKNETTETVRLTDKTVYMKWITHQPWGQDSRADKRSLLAGRCVSIEPAGDDPHAAKLIRISDEQAGTIWYPCR